MKNSSLLIFSIIKNLETVTFKILEIYANIEKVENKIKNINEGTVIWFNYSSRLNKLNKQLQDCMNIQNIEKTIFNILSVYIYKRTHKRTIYHCKRIYNDIENSYYSHKDLIICYLYESLFINKKINMNILTKKRIKQIKNMLTAKQFNKDKKFLLQINDNLNIKDFSEYFIIKNNGTNIIFNLIKEGYITIIFFLFYYKKILTKSQKNINFKCKEYLHFERLINIILKFLN